MKSLIANLSEANFSGGDPLKNGRSIYSALRLKIKDKLDEIERLADDVGALQKLVVKTRDDIGDERVAAGDAAANPDSDPAHSALQTMEDMADGVGRELESLYKTVYSHVSKIEDRMRGAEFLLAKDLARLK